MKRSPTTGMAVVVIAAGAVMLGLSGLIGLAPAEAPQAPDAAPITVATAGLDRSIQQAQDRLRQYPNDDATWARLGSSYVEQAMITADPSYYAKAQGALEKSLQLRPEGNGAALIGMGALANARHEFAAAKDWAIRAQALLPDTADVYAVLADALTQLGEADAATEAVQRMLDLRPSVASFSRASYDLELHGRPDEARAAMERALADATSLDQAAFCHYYLGELAFNAGDLDRAQRHYEAVPDQVAPRQGLAKVTAARGDLAAAIEGYRRIVAAAPRPEYLREYAELLTATGDTAQARAQYAVLEQLLRLAPDDLEAALTAADRGDAATALRLAQAEWGKRKHVQVADALAWALHLSGRDAEALTMADTAAALGTVDATFAYHRGMILRELGRAAEAADQLATTLRINPHFSPVHAPLAEAALAELRAGQ